MSDMKGTLKGVVRDHRLPRDYKFHFAQPSSSNVFTRAFHRYLVVRQLTKNNVTIPLMTLFYFLPIYAAWHVFANYYRSGRWPQAFQRQRWLYRSGNYWVQQIHNANPDNFYDRRFYCWTTDPQCGLEIGPKRPWEDLKDVHKGLANKLDRDVTKTARMEKNGIQGF